MEIRVRTNDRKTYRAKNYRLLNCAVELPYPEIFDYGKRSFVPLGQDFIIIPFSNVYMMKGNLKSRQWKEIW